MNTGDFRLGTAILATVAWYLLDLILLRIPPVARKGPRARYEWYHSIAYPIVAALAIFAVVSEGTWHPHRIVIGQLASHVVSAQVGFFLAGVLLGATSDFPLVRASAIHHGLSIVMYTLLLTHQMLPVLALWVMVVQVTGVVFHPMRLLKQTPNSHPRALRVLDGVHLVSFLGLRVVGYTMATAVFLWSDYRNPIMSTWWWELTKWSCLATYVGLHTVWAAHLLRRPAKRTLEPKDFPQPAFTNPNS